MTGNSHPPFSDAGSQTDFEVIGLTLPRLLDPAVAIAVSRAGGIGVLVLEWGGVEPWRGESGRAWSAADAIQKLARLASRPVGCQNSMGGG